VEIFFKVLAIFHGR